MTVIACVLGLMLEEGEPAQPYLTRRPYHKKEANDS